MAKHDGTEFENGDQVRVKKTREVLFLFDINDKSAKEREEADEYWSEAARDLDTYEGMRDIDSPDDVELVTKAKDVIPAKVPTLAELSEYVSSALHSGFGPLTVDESDIGTNPNGKVEFYGRSATGKRFGALITISEVVATDF
jgi:hypothetical protein